VRVPPTVRLTANDADCFRGATLVLSAIPTQYMRSSWKRLVPYLPPGVPVVSVAKGVENDTLLRPTEVIADVLRRERSAESSEFGVQSSGGHTLAALSGPNIAAEISKYLPATAVAAAEDEGLALRVQAAFSTQWFRVYTNNDVTGVELAGATKNVIAIAAGILDGLAAGNNAKAALVTRGLVEITRLGVAMGAQAATFNGLAGVGDLITTCVSPEGRNRTVGERIGKGQKLQDILAKMDSVAEGVPTTRAVMQLARRYRVEMPITEAVHAVLFEGKDAIHALTDLMARDPKPEAAGE
jgi:glycerol-3-phosphate dehydrogenase (NAD(P)+)